MDIECYHIVLNESLKCLTYIAQDTIQLARKDPNWTIFVYNVIGMSSKDSVIIPRFYIIYSIANVTK